MSKAESNTGGKAVVRFIRQGAEDASFMMGVSGFGGLAAGLIVYKTVESPPKHPANHAITSVPDASHPETVGNQALGVGLMGVGILVGAVAAAAIFGPLARMGHAWAERNPEIQPDTQPTIQTQPVIQED